MSTISELFERYYSKTASVEERKKLMEQLASEKYPEELSLLLQLAWEQADAGEHYFSEAESGRMLAKVLTTGKEFPASVSSRRTPVIRTTWFRYAAMLLLIAGTAALLYFNNQSKQETVRLQPVVQPDINPGSNRAILTLADGSRIVLDSALNGTIAQQQNARIVKMGDGQIAYNIDPKDAAKAVMMNSMSTPKGGQYQLILPDGSRAWLNAASSITYPTAFIGSRRNVQVTGEVYLEIAQNGRQPFSVTVNRTTIDVLGTSFNINAYDNEESIKTTLLEGAVRVSAREHRQVLKPGQQAQVHADGLVRLTDNVDTRQVMAWKNGYFDFNNADVPVVMRQLERWYDISVTFKGNIPRVIFKGKMDRNVRLSDVVVFLGKFGIKAGLQGRNLIISET